MTSSPGMRRVHEITAEQAAGHAAATAESFKKRYGETREPSMSAVEDLSEILFHCDPSIARTAVKPLFSGIVEPLADTYCPRDRKALVKIMARLLSRARDIEGRVDLDPSLQRKAREFDDELKRFDLCNESALRHRVDRERKPKRLVPAREEVVKVLLPSRVTIGADILLLGMAIEKIRRIFPRADIVMIGPGKNGSLFSGDSRVRVREVGYPRRGLLCDRFFSWLDVVRLVKEESLEVDGELLLINLDSRLLQSGLLPVMPEEEEKNHYFFWDPSFLQDSPESPAPPGWSLGERLRTWLHSTFGEDESPALLHPRLRINEADRVFAGKVDERLGLSRRPFTVSMNLGVGGNPRKRIDGAPGLRNRTVPSAFENKLILDILADGATLILDKGFQEEEMNHADALIHTARRANHVVLEISEGGDPGALPVTPPDRPLLIAFRGSVSKLAALIQVTDLYIGYDSQGHHAGAALGRDVIAVFAGYDSPEFPHRWRPLGPGVINVVCAGPGPFEEPEQEALAGRVLALSKTARQRKGGI